MKRKEDSNLNLEGIELFRNHIKEDLSRLFFDILLEMGLKVSQAVSLRFSQFDFSSQLFLPKNIKISKALNELLIEQKRLSDSSFVFSTRQSKSMTPRRAQQIFSHYSNISGVKITPKDLRKLFLTKNLQKGLTPDSVSQKSGLKNIKQPTKLFSKSINLSLIAEKRDFLLLSIIRETGCKTSQLSKLKVQDILFDDKEKKPSIQISQSQIIQISYSLFEALNSYCKDFAGDDYVFRNHIGSALSSRRIQQIFAHYSKVFSVDITPRSLRNAFAVELHEKGLSNREIEKILGVKRVDAFTHGIIELDRSLLGPSENSDDDENARGKHSR